MASAEIAQELRRLIVVARKYGSQILISQVAGDGFSNYLTEVRRESEVAAFVELRLIESWPAAVHLAALHRAAENEHHIRVTVIGAAIAVLARGASELRHRDDNGVFAEIAEIDPERGERLREVTEHVCQLTFGRALVDVMVPARDVGERNLHAKVCFDQLRELAKAFAEAALWDSWLPVQTHIFQGPRL